MVTVRSLRFLWAYCLIFIVLLLCPFTFSKIIHVDDAALIAPDVDPYDMSFKGTSFTGVFDGGGHTISHLTITGECHLGLFGQLDSGAKISNLCMGKVDINETGDCVGGLVSENYEGNITTYRNTDTVSGETYVRGELIEDTTWTGTVVLEETVTVPAGMILNIKLGTIVSMMDSVSIIVYGQLIADGNEAEPIRFTRHADNITWKQILFVEAEDSRFTHCIFEYADCEGAHQDYYEPGPRNYHEAIVALGTHLDFEGCTFQNLPDGSDRAEGDAIAIIADDPNHPGEASANIRNCQFLSIGQGVHTRFSYVLVEDCFFTGKHGDNDDVDLWGESMPPPLIKNNLFLNPEQEDMINPTRCSAIITGNVIIGSDDHGIVLRDKGFPVVMNNLIVDCSTAGIAIENSCEALLVNNTIVDCGRGLRLFDLGRWGPPYRLNPGGGTATLVNCIIWDCPQPVTLADSSSTVIEDAGSHITISYSVIPGGQDGVIISGTNSTVTWGQGNINDDPQFADPANGDYHLKSTVGRWDPVTEGWVSDDITSPCIDTGDPNYLITPDETDLDGHPRIMGTCIDMGVYENLSDTSSDPNQEAKGPAPNSVKSLAVYEERIGEPGLLIEDDNLQMWVPKRYEEHSLVIFQYFKNGYEVLSDMFGGHDMAVKFSIEHYAPGSSFFWGGTDGQGAIRYSYRNLEDDYSEWNLYSVPHVMDYYEEMAHCFARDMGIIGERSVGYYETIGLMFGQETALRAAWNPYIQNLIDIGHQQDADTARYYQNNNGACNVQNNICLTRILTHAFKTEVVDKYGWDSFAATFNQLIQDGYPLRHYDRNHTWGGFLSYLEHVIGTDLEAIFGQDYGLPWIQWTCESGYETDGVEPVAMDIYRFRIRILDREGVQPVDVKLHLYGYLMTYMKTYDMLAVGGDQDVGWIYEVTLQIPEPEGCQYAFSANDGMHDVFQAIGEPTVIHPIE